MNALFDFQYKILQQQKFIKKEKFEAEDRLRHQKVFPRYEERALEDLLLTESAEIDDSQWELNAAERKLERLYTLSSLFLPWRWVMILVAKKKCRKALEFNEGNVSRFSLERERLLQGDRRWAFDTYLKNWEQNAKDDQRERCDAQRLFNECKIKLVWLSKLGLRVKQGCQKSTEFDVLSSYTEELIELSQQCFESGDYISALELLNNKAVRIEPNIEILQQLQEEAEQKRQEALTFIAGHASVPQFGNVAKTSIDTALPYLHDQGHLQINMDWPIYGEQLTNPLISKPNALWILYWQAFRATQNLIETLKTDVSEDIYSSELVKELAAQVPQAEKEFRKLGYKNCVMDMMRFVSAGKKTETDSGADIGFILDIVLEDRRYIRCGILQMKNAYGENESVWREENRQLKRLTRINDLGKYGFFHIQPNRSAPAVTVKSADEVMSQLKKNAEEKGVPLEGLHNADCNVGVFQDSLDFPTYYAFGLGGQGSQHGVSVDNIFEAIELITTKLDTHEQLSHQIMVHSVGCPVNESVIKIFREIGYKQCRETTKLVRRQRPSPSMARGTRR